MVLVEVPFRLHITGDAADQHELQAYDGYSSLAGFSLTLALVTNYVETGKIRHRGNFDGRMSVRAVPIQEGSVVSDFIVRMAKVAVGGILPNSPEAAAALLVDLTKRTIDRNLGIVPSPQTDALKALEGESKSGGDLEALVAATDASVRQTHQMIGSGAKLLDIYGGTKRLGRYDPTTKAYVNGTITSDKIQEKDVSVASFNVNSGYGGVFDFDLGRVVPILVNRDTLIDAKSVLTWGIDQYAKGTGKKITLRFRPILALDDTVKKYLVIDARIPPDDLSDILG
jgi:hypothetical protein